jgi:hypothetical protein
MSLQNRLLPIVTITGSSLVVGCGGYSGGSCGSYGYGSYGSSAACVPPNIGGPGYYEGTLTGQGAPQATPVVAIIADNGDGAMSGQDGTYYRLNVNLSGNNVSGTFYGLSQGATFPNGTQATSGSISAIAAPPGLNGTVTDQTNVAETLALSFDTVYNLGSSLATLAGTWSYTANGFSLTATIRPDGTFSATDSNNCSYSGAFGLIDPNFNAYSESYTRSCNSINVMFTGLATYFPPSGNTRTADIKILADDNTGEFLVADLQ